MKWHTRDTGECDRDNWLQKTLSEINEMVVVFLLCLQDKSLIKSFIYTFILIVASRTEMDYIEV